MDDIASAANLELAPLFGLAALALTLGVRWVGDRKRSLRSAGADDDFATDRGAGTPG